MNLTKISEQSSDTLGRIISNNNYLERLIAGLNQDSDPRHPAKSESDSEGRPSNGIILDVDLTSNMLEGASMYQQKLLSILEHVLYAYNPESNLSGSETKSLIKG